MSGKKRTLQDYYTLASSRNFEWAGSYFPKHTHVKTTWRCASGHEWQAAFHDIQQGNGCPYCSGKFVKTEDDYYLLAKQRGFKWVGTKPKYAKENTLWECAFGHRWEAAYSFIKQGNGCPYCYGNAKKTKEDYHKLATEHGLKFIGPFPDNTSQKTYWECLEGHRWYTTYSEINSGYSCAHCAGIAKKTKEDYLSLAKEIGYEWLDCNLDPVPNTHAKSRWKCDANHLFETRYDTLKRGQRCPYCFGNAKKTPDDYHKIAEEIGYKWLGPEVDTVTDKTLWECPEGHIWEARYSSLKAGYGCQTCARSYSGHKIRIDPLAYSEMEDLTGYKLLEPVPEYVGDKVLWKCDKGHIIQTSYDSLRSGRRCSVCYESHRGETLRKTEEDYRSLAQERGYTWIGPMPNYTNDKSLWICDQGHEWQVRYSDVLQGVGCPQCAYSLWVNGQRASKVQLALAEQLNIDEEHINYKYGPYWLDMAYPDLKICIEYDSWYWHDDPDRDERRDNYLLGEGWKILHVKSGGLLPDLSDVERSLVKLVTNKSRIEEIILEDWRE